MPAPTAISATRLFGPARAASYPPALAFFLALVIDGALAGTLYALIALAFVLVYKASRIVNFAIGEWIMFGALVTAAGFHQIGLGLAAALVFGMLGMAVLGVAFN